MIFSIVCFPSVGGAVRIRNGQRRRDSLLRRPLDHLNNQLRNYFTVVFSSSNTRTWVRAGWFMSSYCRRVLFCRRLGLPRRRRRNVAAKALSVDIRTRFYQLHVSKKILTPRQFERIYSEYILNLLRST